MVTVDTSGSVDEVDMLHRVREAIGALLSTD